MCEPLFSYARIVKNEEEEVEFRSLFAHRPRFLLSCDVKNIFLIL